MLSKRYIFGLLCLFILRAYKCSNLTHSDEIRRYCSHNWDPRSGHDRNGNCLCERRSSVIGGRASPTNAHINGSSQALMSVLCQHSMKVSSGVLGLTKAASFAHNISFQSNNIDTHTHTKNFASLAVLNTILAWRD